MNAGPHSLRRGFTLIELLVVMAIIGLLAGLITPFVSGFGIFSRSELPRATRLVHSKITAARIYASTYRVNTAVVYVLDNWHRPTAEARYRLDNASIVQPGRLNLANMDPDAGVFTGATAPVGVRPGIAEPINSAVTGQLRRLIVAAAVMYQLPRESGSARHGRYVPVPDDIGNFDFFEGDMALLLSNPTEPPESRENYYIDGRTLYRPPANDSSLVIGSDAALSLSSGNSLEKLGMASVPAFLDDSYTQVDLFPAHVFDSNGRMQVSSTSASTSVFEKERFTIYVGPSPALPPDATIVEASSPTGVRTTIHRKIFLHRSSGRVRIES